MSAGTGAVTVPRPIPAARPNAGSTAGVPPQGLPQLSRNLLIALENAAMQKILTGVRVSIDSRHGGSHYRDQRALLNQSRGREL